jgi:hypothetical protein
MARKKAAKKTKDKPTVKDYVEGFKKKGEEGRKKNKKKNERFKKFRDGRLGGGRD